MDGIGNFIELAQTVVFQIPLNQRGYAWEKANWDALISDVEGLEDNVNHYCGPLVITKTLEVKKVLRGFNNDIPIVNVEDGQQRVTTLILAALAFVHECESRSEELARVQQYKEQLIKNVLFWADEALAPIESYTNRRLIAQNTKYDRFLEDLFREGKGAPSNAAMRRLNKMLQHQRKFFSKKDDEGMYKSFQDLYSRLQFVIVELTQNRINPNVAFHTINSRGVPLRAFDIVKNSLMHRGEHFNESFNVERSWFKSVSKLDDSGLAQNEDDFLKLAFSLTFQRGQVTGNASEKIIEMVSEGDAALTQRRIQQIAKGWEDLVGPYCKVCSPRKNEFYIDSRTNSSANNIYIHSLRRIDSMQLSGIPRPLFVAVEFVVEDLEAKARIGVLLEKFVFRIWCVGKKRTNFLQNAILKLASDLIHGDVSLKSVEFTLIKWIAKHAPLDDLLRDMFDTNRLNYTNWETNRTHYFLLEYEHYLQNNVDHPPSWKKDWDQVEHVCPQIQGREADVAKYNRLHEDWQAAFGSVLIWQQHKHRLGNLCLTRQNQELKAKPWAKKRELYELDSATRSERQLPDFVTEEGWGPKAIKKKELALAKFFVRRWNIGLDSEQDIATPEFLSDIMDVDNLGSEVPVIYVSEEIERIRAEQEEEVTPPDEEVSVE